MPHSTTCDLLTLKPNHAPCVRGYTTPTSPDQRLQCPCGPRASRCHGAPHQTTPPLSSCSKKQLTAEHNPASPHIPPPYRYYMPRACPCPCPLLLAQRRHVVVQGLPLPPPYLLQRCTVSCRMPYASMPTTAQVLTWPAPPPRPPAASSCSLTRGCPQPYRPVCVCVCVGGGGRR